jgi:hypothetical protein
MKLMMLTEVIDFRAFFRSRKGEKLLSFLWLQSAQAERILDRLEWSESRWRGGSWSRKGRKVEMSDSCE